MKTSKVCGVCAEGFLTCCQLNPRWEEFCFPLSDLEIKLLGEHVPHTNGCFVLMPNSLAFIQRLEYLFPLRKEILKISCHSYEQLPAPRDPHGEHSEAFEGVSRFKVQVFSSEQGQFGVRSLPNSRLLTPNSKLPTLNSEPSTRNPNLNFSIRSSETLPFAGNRLSKNPLVNFCDGVAAGHDHGFSEVFGKEIHLCADPLRATPDGHSNHFPSHHHEVRPEGQHLYHIEARPYTSVRRNGNFPLQNRH